MMDHLDGIGTGVSLILVGLVVTIGDISLGAMLGVPMILMGLLFPMMMTYRAKQESDRQAARRGPTEDRSAGYTINTKSLRRRRNQD